MKRRPAAPYHGPTCHGIDVSSYQAEVDWHRVATRFAFVFVRTGDGDDRDTHAVQHIRGATAAGLRVGAYHYFRADRDGAAQARLVRRVLDDAGVPLTLPVALDYERKSGKNLTGGIYLGQAPSLPIDLIVHEALEFKAQLIDDGTCERPIVYTGEAFHWLISQARPELAQGFADSPLWTPSYGEDVLMPVDKDGRFFPWPFWTFWQHDSKGTVPGIQGHVDLDIFRGSLAALDAFAAGAPICG